MASSTSTTSSTPPPTEPTPVAPSAGAWQAIFSPQHNAYYFFNSETQETTWQNPLVQDSTTPTESEPATPATDSTPTSLMTTAAQQAAISQGIDPALAHLDPSLALAGTSSSTGVQYGATAKFNARTGQFARPDARDPSHLSEFERAKRMSEFYFDVGAWEQQREQDKEAEAEAEEGGKKRKRPTKKDLERFKQQKKLKKIAKTAWLRT